jgi:hypothetical protein
MFVNQKITARLLSVMLAMVLTSGCSMVGATGWPQQMKQAQAVHAFDENRAPYGQRIAAAWDIYRPQVYGLNPAFGR